MALDPRQIVGPELVPILEKVERGERLSREDGLVLATNPNLTGVGHLANIVRERRHGAKTYFVRNQHINYTNICNKFCKFCSFYAKKGGPAPYQMTLDEVKHRLEWHRDVPLTEIHMVGGINPRLPYSYYMDLVRVVKEARPGVHVKAFTAVEIVEIARQGKVTVDQALADLIEAGLDSLPGGGIEILSDRVHAELFGKKLNGEEWKDVARAAAKLGLRQYATMLYGHIETVEEVIDHLIQLRELQDETGHFLTMTPLSFHPEATELDDIAGPTGDDDLRNIALCRLMLDNFAHIKSFWILNTVPITYKSGEWGNKSQSLTYDNMVRMIQEAGRIPVERDSLYHEITPKVLQATIRPKLVPIPVRA